MLRSFARRPERPRAHRRRRERPQKPPIAEEVFKNVQILKGIPVNEFMETMGFFSASWAGLRVLPRRGGRRQTGQSTPTTTAPEADVSQDDPHDGGHQSGELRGRQVVTCYTCHRGGNRPKVTPSLKALYSAPPLEEPTI